MFSIDFILAALEHVDTSTELLKLEITSTDLSSARLIVCWRFSELFKLRRSCHLTACNRITSIMTTRQNERVHPLCIVN